MKKLRILVIDDNAKNIAKAIEQLSLDHELTTVSSFIEAQKILNQSETGAEHWYKEGEPNFDVVLTDLFLPEDTKGVRSDSLTGKDQPYGFIFAFSALRRGVKMVAIVSLGGHHNNPINWALDMIGYEMNRGVFQFGEQKFMCGGYDEKIREDDGTQTKDWKKILQTLIEK